jgi:hypothetical protein
MTMLRRARSVRRDMERDPSESLYAITVAMAEAESPGGGQSCSAGSSENDAITGTSWIQLLDKCKGMEIYDSS